MRTVGSSNNILGNIIGADTVLDLDIAGSSNDFLFDVDKDNAYGAQVVTTKSISLAVTTTLILTLVQMTLLTMPILI